MDESLKPHRNGSVLGSQNGGGMRHLEVGVRPQAETAATTSYWRQLPFLQSRTAVLSPPQTSCLMAQFAGDATLGGFGATALNLSSSGSSSSGGLEVRIGSGRYRLQYKVGSGSFGDIYHGVDVASGQHVAV